MDTLKNVMEYGAAGDGTKDDYDAIQKALDSGAEKIIIPFGVYNVSETLKVKSNTHIIADKCARIVMKSNKRKQRGDFLLSNADLENGNKNIKITGGIWDGNNTAKENQKPDLFDKNGYSGAVLNFYNVSGLELSDMVIANSVTYYIRMSKLYDFKIEDISFISDNFGVNQDGLHFGGDVKNGYVKNIRALSDGQTNDDMVALNADDSVERVENLDLCRASIENITFDGIYAKNCYTIVRLLSVTAPIKNISFKNIYAGFRGYAINADGARHCKTPLFNEDDYPQGVGKIENIYFENFTCFPVYDLPAEFKGANFENKAALKMETLIDKFVVKGFKYLTDKKDAYPAIDAKNVCNEKLCIDGADYILNTKDDKLIVDSFENLSINLI